MKLFTVAIKANRRVRNGIETEISSVTGLFHSRSEAEGEGMIFARKQWPSVHGWEAHLAVASEIPRNVIEAAYQQR